jgi:phosphohistidine phosphatase SixA
LATREQLLEFIWSIEGNSDILIIGHNDGISSLASYFANEFISLSTAEFVTIDFEVETWKETSEGNGSVLRMCQPSL